MPRARSDCPPPASHEDDIYRWALETAAAVRTRRFVGIEWDAVAEELEDMARSERRALESRFEVLFGCLYRAHQCAAWSGAGTAEAKPEAGER